MTLASSTVPPPFPSLPLLRPSSHTVALTLKSTSRRSVIISSLSLLSLSCPSLSFSSTAVFFDLDSSTGLKALDLRIGDGETPVIGDRVAIHYYGRLAAKQGWRFDSTYDHKDETGSPLPFEFVIGSGKVISGIEAAVKSMKVGGVRRVIIPPSQGYQNTSQEPIPPNVHDCSLA